jgi:hypothetical protein
MQVGGESILNIFLNVVLGKTNFENTKIQKVHFHASLLGNGPIIFKF